ncbi:unnamed protein product, partial [Hapterophycus canaliculatus]
VTELPDANNDQRAYWVTQQAVLEGEVARFQALAHSDPEAARQLQATDAQLQAVTQRIRNYDEEKAEELAEEQEAQSKGRRQLCYFMILLAAGLLAIAIWALV